MARLKWLILGPQKECTAAAGLEAARLVPVAAAAVVAPLLWALVVALLALALLLAVALLLALPLPVCGLA